MPPQSDHEWLSGHVFIRGRLGDGAGDQTILDVVEPFVRECQSRGWIDRFFFIRYGELGPHIRVRLHGRTDVLRMFVRPAFETCVAERLPADLGDQPTGTLPPGAEQSGAPSLAWIPYEPETVRYGGPAALPIAEELFCRSADLVFALLRTSPSGDRATRLGRALPTMVCLIAAFIRDRAEAARLAWLHRDSFVGGPEKGQPGHHWHSRFEASFERQSTHFQDMVTTFWDAAIAGGLPAPLDAYRDAAARARADLLSLIARRALVHPSGLPVEHLSDAARMLVPSYGHMTNNRMGLSPIEEGYLMHAIGRALVTRRSEETGDQSCT